MGEIAGGLGEKGVWGKRKDLVQGLWGNMVWGGGGEGTEEGATGRRVLGVWRRGWVEVGRKIRRW